MTIPPAPSLRLGYVCIEARDLNAWERFGRDVGFHVERRDGLLLFRLDDRDRRFILWEGPRDDVVQIGWQADDAAALEAMRRRLTSLDKPTTDLDAAALEVRGVRAAFAFEVFGLPFEVFHGANKSSAPLQLGVSGFVAGDIGIGHIAFLTKNNDEAAKEIQKVFGARHTDDILGTFAGLNIALRFMRVNERHHSIALAQFVGVDMPPPPKRLAHIMVEVPKIEDVGAALARCRVREYPFGMDLGKHSNDDAISFYVVTPSGFELEVATGPKVITDDSAWTPSVYDRLSVWGHQLPAPPAAP